MNRVGIYQIVSTTEPTGKNGFIFSNSCTVGANKYGVFSLGAGISLVGFNDLSNVSNPLYQSIITNNCVLSRMSVTMCQTVAFNSPTGFEQKFDIYKNGNLELSTILDGTAEVLFLDNKINIPFAIGDLISFSLDNTNSGNITTISLHTFFENA
jgi:hypothetical protein